MVYEGLIFALLSLIVLGTCIIVGIQKGKGGWVPTMRAIPGLQAIEESVGRATEMGKPVHYTTGIATISGMEAAQTLAGLEILGYTSKLIARYGSRLIVTINKPEVFPLADEIVRTSFMTEGAIELYDPESVQYLSSTQFAYAAGVMGIMHREEVAANIMLGSFYAEALMFAEAGQQIGAIQIAGTANLHQIPFFVAACDYTLIGEELYAGGAVVSENSVRLGSIAGQDIGKLIAVVIIAIGVVSVTMGSSWFTNLLSY